MAEESFANGLYRSMADFYPLSLSKLREELDLEGKVFEAFSENVSIPIANLESQAKQAYEYHDQILVRKRPEKHIYVQMKNNLAQGVMTLETSVLVRLLKSSNVELGDYRYLDGRLFKKYCC